MPDPDDENALFAQRARAWPKAKCSRASRSRCRADHDDRDRRLGECHHQREEDAVIVPALVVRIRLDAGPGDNLANAGSDIRCAGAGQLSS